MITLVPPSRAALPSLEGQRFGAILADPPWRFETWSDAGKDRSPERHYDTMTLHAMADIDVAGVAADDCVLFMWATWPMLPQALELISAWGFKYKTCGFDWMKADVRQVDLFREDADVQVGPGYWTRANTEPCLLATRGKPTRNNADVRMGIIEKRR
jgi:N6-adenosine-specific RNA methylase IME4